MQRTRIFQCVDCAKSDTRATRLYKLGFDELPSTCFRVMMRSFITWESEAKLPKVYIPIYSEMYYTEEKGFRESNPKSDLNI